MLKILEKPIQEKALANVVHHLWGYLKKEASPDEKGKYLNWPQEQLYALLDYFYCMAQKYDKKYLLQSTVFADLINEV